MEALAKAGEGLELGASELSLVDLFTSFFYVLNLSIWIRLRPSVIELFIGCNSYFKKTNKNRQINKH